MDENTFSLLVKSNIGKTKTQNMGDLKNRTFPNHTPPLTQIAPTSMRDNEPLINYQSI
jgi:hypothetical protein